VVKNMDQGGKEHGSGRQPCSFFNNSFYQLISPS
jgi:hypothetical protein